MIIESLLYKREHKITEQISVVIPTVKEVLEHEEEYYSMVHIITAMPIDLMVALDDAGIDFSTIDEYELFLLTSQSLKNQDTELIFGEFNISNFEPVLDQQHKRVILYDDKNDIIIDKMIHAQIADTLRTIHGLKKDRRKPANEEAKKYMIRRAREKMKRQKNKKERSQLEQLIVAMVNTEQYKYDFEGTRELSIYQFNECVRQITQKVDYDNRMHGIYSGTISAKDMKPADFNWLTHK